MNNINIPIYKPLSWLTGRHVDTIYAKFRQPAKPNYRRELRLDSSGQTQVAYDFIDSISKHDVPLVVLFPGLEGSSNSHYARALMYAIALQKWHGVVVNYRGCGGVVNTSPLAYHAGDSTEVEFVLKQLSKQYTIIYAMGISLGGNMLAKYMGEQKNQAIPQAVAIVSSPLNLLESANALNSSRTSTIIYGQYFLPRLLAKAHDMITHFPELGLDSHIKAKTLTEFDEQFTCPLYGFKDTQDYYTQSSAFNKLKNITYPALIINAVNDPFLPPYALPQPNDVSHTVQLYQPQRGGHAGFVSGNGLGHINWLPQAVLAFFKHYYQYNIY